MDVTEEYAASNPETTVVETVRAAAIDAEHLEHQRRWSESTFGPGPRTAGVLDHIGKELDEIRADPLDVNEWVDVVILAFDGAWRAGWEPQEIIDAIKAKQVRNEARTWPDWRTSDPDKAIEHTPHADERVNAALVGPTDTARPWRACCGSSGEHFTHCAAARRVGSTQDGGPDSPHGADGGVAG